MIVFRALAAILVFCAYAWCLVFFTVFQFGRRDEARPADAIVVLGAAQYDGRPSPVLKARLDHGIELFQAGLANRMILTGGVGVGDTVSEAEVGRRYAMRAGVDSSAVLLERSGLSSDASMSAVGELMRANQLSSAVLVSDPFHMLRLRLLARRWGIRAHASPTRSSPIDAGSAEEWRHILREALILPSLLFGERIAPFRERPDTSGAAF